MARVGGTKRGEGKFERLSWDEANKRIASEWLRVLKEYGPEAVHRKYGTGTLSSGTSNRNEWFRLANMLGGYLQDYNSYSYASISEGTNCMYGAFIGNGISDLANSKLIVMFGSNLMELRASGGGLSYELMEAIRNGKTKVIIIDPRFTDTASKIADQWIPIRPGSDAALCAAIAYTLITENLVDQPFLDRYCIGFDEEHLPDGVEAGSSYKAYVLGEGPDKTPKTPEWASRITGCPPDTIIKLAREIGTAKPA